MPIQVPPVGATACPRTVYGFTNKQCIINLYSQRGYDHIVSDTEANEDSVVDAFISDAEQTIISRLSQFHSNTDLANSDWVQSRATWIAAYLLSKRRGNEHYFEDMYTEALRELDAIATGELPPIPDIPLREYTIPAMSNFIIDDHFGQAKVRVRQHISVGESYPDQHISFGYFWGWL